ncbi:pituitary-specific positive transcription factor 1-like [Danio aesculapii]|uniref:pituitary-specific positive transcription factor 1-like n=1 Tax=Danio aesculapii TaxID=1142201 RepID=UPI0024BF974E|nr:pituitary-specific positive transcription factor 1-like [Danio aesculapii]
MSCQAFSTSDSFSGLGGDTGAALPLLMHHSAAADCHHQNTNICSTVPSGLPLVQSSKRSHMHLSTSALGNASASLHYPMPPCHYSNQQTTYGMMAAQEMLSASISQTRILQTCSVPHANMVNGANSLQGRPPTYYSLKGHTPFPVPLITDIIHSSLTGIVPSSLKVAAVTPI